jgi:NAD(P)-dependent dehydrogenase (short-subunit alcohol dehydrogenase family)
MLDPATLVGSKSCALSRLGLKWRAMNSLEGKVVLVTGAAKRIGRAIALELAGAGADVVITYLTSRQEAGRTIKDLRRAGVRSLALRCDVRRQSSVRATLNALLKEFGRLDVVVNNAGLYETAAFDTLTTRQWDNVFAVNVRGPFLMVQEALRPLRESGEGRVINLGSLGGLRPWTTHAHYCSSKAALIMLTRVMAKALAPEIAVNCVAPGMIDFGEKASAKFYRNMAAKTPMRHNGTGEDVAAAVRFFATAPQFITGQTIAVDGGLELA